MIDTLIEDIARQLVVLNASWMEEVRTIGYVVREPETVITDFENEIGLTDRRKNSGYIRFRQDVNFTRDDIPTRASCGIQSSRYTFYLRLVVACKTTTPENVSVLLATQLNSLSLSFDGVDNIRLKVISGGSNSISITKQEAAKEQLNSEYRAVYVDFNLLFDWRNDCDQIEITMACDNCTSTTDYGCIQHCDTLTVHANIDYTGTATINTNFNGVVVVQSIEVTEGEDIEIDLSGLNENYTYSIQIRDADGEVIEVYSKDHANGHNQGAHTGTTYDCFTIQLLP